MYTPQYTYVTPTVMGLNAVTATTVGNSINIKGAKKVTIMGTRAAHSSGSTAFSVDVSIDDGVTFVDYNRLVTNVANANTETHVRAASFTLAANGSAIASLDLVNDVFTHMKVTATETTDGTHSASALIEY